MANESLLPEGWPRPSGYAMGVKARGALIFTGGIIGWGPDGAFAGPDMATQFDRILETTVAVLAAGGAAPEHVVRMTWYIVSREEYVASLRAIGDIYRRHMGRNFPAMAVVEVKALVESAARIEIETTAVIPA